MNILSVTGANGKYLLLLTLFSFVLHFSVWSSMIFSICKPRRLKIIRLTRRKQSVELKLTRFWITPIYIFAITPITPFIVSDPALFIIFQDYYFSIPSWFSLQNAIRVSECVLVGSGLELNWVTMLYIYVIVLIPSKLKDRSLNSI